MSINSRSTRQSFQFTSGSGKHRRTTQQKLSAATDIVLERLEDRTLLSAAAGTLDSNFGASGLVNSDLGASADQGNALAVESNGDIAVAGQSNGQFSVALYTPN